MSEKLYPGISHSNHRKSKMKKKAPADPLPARRPPPPANQGVFPGPAETKPARRRNEAGSQLGRENTNLEFHTLGK